MSTPRILLVDDTISNLDILVSLLHEYDIVEATNGKDALQILKTQKIDLIILDIIMPAMNGLEVCKKIRQNPKTKNIPVIFITASPTDKNIQEAYDAGGYDYITKPFNPKELLIRVQTQLKLQTLKYTEQQYSKQIALSELIHNIAHQWRQPLSVISLLASEIVLRKKMDLIDDEEIISSGKEIVNITTNLSNTIQNFQTIFDKEYEESLFKIHKLIENNYDTLFFSHSDDLDIIMNIDENLEINSSKSKIMHVLLSIIQNSKDVLRHKNVPHKAIFLNIKKYKKKKLLIEIYDTGQGIEEEIIDKIFEPYFTTKHKSQGKGLGLYMVQTIINETLNGSIKVSNYNFKYKEENCVGAKFDIILNLEKKN